MATENKSVLDGKLSNEQLGGLTRRHNEIIRRVNEGTLNYDEVMALLQGVIIEGKNPFIGVLKGTHEIKIIEQVMIDCDALPCISDGWEVVEHQKGGMIKFDPSKVDFYLSKKQKNGSIKGNKLYKELKDKKVKILNANVLDYLFKNPHLIPDSWKGKVIFFWGTIFHDSGGSTFVPCLCWDGSIWYPSYHRLFNVFDAANPAACLRS